MKIGEEIRRLKIELEDMLLRLYFSGKYSHGEIAQMTGCEYNTVVQFYSRRRKEYNFPKMQYPTENCAKKNAITKKNIKEAQLLYNDGASLAKVGEEFGGISRQAVSYMFKKYNIETRKVHMTEGDFIS